MISFCLEFAPISNSCAALSRRTTSRSVSSTLDSSPVTPNCLRLLQTFRLKPSWSRPSLSRLQKTARGQTLPRVRVQLRRSLTPGPLVPGVTHDIPRITLGTLRQRSRCADRRIEGRWYFPHRRRSNSLSHSPSQYARSPRSSCSFLRHTRRQLLHRMAH